MVVVNRKSWNLMSYVYATLRFVYWNLRHWRLYRRDCYYIGPDCGNFKDRANWKDGKIPNIFSKIISETPNLPVLSEVMFPELECVYINVPKHFAKITTIYGLVTVKEMVFNTQPMHCSNQSWSTSGEW